MDFVNENMHSDLVMSMRSAFITAVSMTGSSCRELK